MVIGGLTVGGGGGMYRNGEITRNVVDRLPTILVLLQKPLEGAYMLL